MDIKLEAKQSLQLSARMVQNLEVLQMGSLQLLEYIERLELENPTVELEEVRLSEEDIVFQNKLKWLEATDYQNKVYYSADEDGKYDPFFAYSRDNKVTLGDFLSGQVATMKLDAETVRVARFIIDSLDESGYLSESDEELIEAAEASPETVGKAVGVVQSLEPEGSGARSLSECLLLQLKGKNEPLAEKIVKDCLAHLGKNRYAAIAKELGADEHEVIRACDLIRSLNPRPSSGFAAREDSVYITPDLFVVAFSDHFNLLTNDYYFPQIRINTYYSQMFRECRDKEVKDYLADKLRQTRWVIGSIDQRKKMILRCAEKIAERQERFFRYGRGNLAPMTLADLAESLNVHESTVSRAVKDKYMQCGSGIYPLSYFFSRNIGNAEDGTTSDKAQAEIRGIIDGEDKKKPYSDAKICELLSEKGVEISRRTVAKYRDQIGIGSTSMRKER